MEQKYLRFSYCLWKKTFYITLYSSVAVTEQGGILRCKMQRECAMWTWTDSFAGTILQKRAKYKGNNTESFSMPILWKEFQAKVITLKSGPVHSNWSDRTMAHQTPEVLHIPLCDGHWVVQPHCKVFRHSNLIHCQHGIWRSNRACWEVNTLAHQVVAEQSFLLLYDLTEKRWWMFKSTGYSWLNYCYVIIKTEMIIYSEI